MSTITLSDLLNVHQDITEVMAGIDKCMNPGVDRAIAWKKLNDSRNILRRAIESAGSVEIKEAA